MLYAANFVVVELWNCRSVPNVIDVVSHVECFARKVNISSRNVGVIREEAKLYKLVP